MSLKLKIAVQDLERGIVRMYAYFFLTTKRRSIRWGTDVLPFAAVRQNSLVEFLYHMQEAPLTKIHWLVY